MSTQEKTSNEFDSLRAALTQEHPNYGKIIADARNLSPEEQEAIHSLAMARMGKEINTPPPPHNEPESDLVAPNGYAGDRKKAEQDRTNSENSAPKSKEKGDELEAQKGKLQKEKFSKDEMKSESGHREDGAQDGSSEERTASNGKKRNRSPKSGNIKKTLEYLAARKQIKDVYKDDPLEAFKKLSEQKPDGQAPSYIQQKYDTDRSELLHEVDERIKTSPEGTKYSPEKLGEELYKYQTNAETDAFAKDILKNNQNNTELQESYKEAANNAPQTEEQNEQSNQQEQNTPSFRHRLRRFLGGQRSS